MEMKKVVISLNLHDDRDKKMAIKAVSSIAGIDSIAVNMKDNKMKVIGDVDPVEVTNKLRKPWKALIDTVGPAKEEKKTDDKKPIEIKEIPQIVPFYPPYYYVNSYDENPNACTIC